MSEQWISIIQANYCQSSIKQLLLRGTFLKAGIKTYCKELFNKYS